MNILKEKVVENLKMTAQANEGIPPMHKLNLDCIPFDEAGTWRPITGCTKISAGCDNCPAEVIAKRYQSMGHSQFKNGFKLTLHNDAVYGWNAACEWPKVHNYSSSDWFQEEIPFDFLDGMMKVIESRMRRYCYIVTKRAERMAQYFSTRLVPYNAFLGVAVENQAVKGRIDFLRRLKAPIRFLYCQPLLEDLGKLELNGIDWVIVGGEGGRNARPMKPEWVINIQKQCEEQKVPFYFEKWGAWGEDGVKRSTELNGNTLNGKIYQESHSWERFREQFKSTYYEMITN